MVMTVIAHLPMLKKTKTSPHSGEVSMVRTRRCAAPTFPGESRSVDFKIAHLGGEFKEGIGGLEDWKIGGLEDWKIRGFEDWRIRCNSAMAGWYWIIMIF
jgi:hypothetical protein